MPWNTAGCFGYWGTPPHGTITYDGSNLIELVNDMQPASSYPVGKTGPFPLTGTGATRPLYQGGAIYTADSPTAADKLSSTAAELLALVNGNDKPFSMLMVMAVNTVPFGAVAGGYAGPFFSGSGDQIRMTSQAGTNKVYIVRYDGSTLRQNSSPEFDDTDKHVYLITFNGTNYALYSEEGTLISLTLGTSGTIATTVFDWMHAGASSYDLALWDHALDADERTTEIGRAAARRNVPFPPDYRYTTHDFLLGGGRALVDDSTMAQPTEAAALAKRQEAINYLWDGALPTSTPSVTEDVNPAVDNVLSGYSPSDCSQIDRLDLTVPITLTDESTVDAHLVGFHYHTSAAPSGNCILICHGHGHHTEGVGAISNLIQAALTAGHAVVTTHMVCEVNPYNSYTEPAWIDPPEAGHAWLGTNAVRASYIGIHLELPITCLNLFSGTYSRFAISGLSGGGWATAIVAALDARVDAAYPVAGTAPMWLRMGSAGDIEQYDYYWYELLPYPTQYQAACSSGRRLVFVYNEDDACCFGPNQYSQTYPRNSGLDYEAAQDDFVAQLVAGGCDAAWWFDTTAVGHQLTAWTAAQIVADLAAVWA